MFFLYQIFQDLTGLLFPGLCCGCGIHLHSGESYICVKCLHHIPYTDHHLYTENKTAKQLWARVPFNAAMALLYYKKGTRVQNMIHHLKYKSQPGLGIKLGNMIGERLLSAPLYKDIDLIIPVPLHKKKERERGYNQSQCISEGISAVLRVPVNTTCLVKNLATDTQTKKTRYKRYENMKAVFNVTKPEEIKDRHILIVDDVITTGATIESCAIALQKCNIKKLSIAAAAFAE